MSIFGIKMADLRCWWAFLNIDCGPMLPGFLRFLGRNYLILVQNVRLFKFVDEFSHFAPFSMIS